MANIIVLENEVERTMPAVHGEEITIKAPCNCSEVTGVQIADVVYPFYDAAGNPMKMGTGLFTEGSLIRVLIDTENTRAMILNHAVTPESIGVSGGSGWTIVDMGFTGNNTSLKVMNATNYIGLFDSPIMIPENGVVEFELKVFGATSDVDQSGELTLVSKAGNMGKLVINSNNCSQTITSSCIVNGSNVFGVYSREGYIIENYGVGIYYNDAHPFTRANTLEITNFNWTTSGTITCYGYILRYRILE